MRSRPPLLFAAVLALAAAGPASSGCVSSPEAAIAALNALRAQPRSCGDRRRPAVPALAFHALLQEAAQRHAAELARADRIDHIGEAGQSLRARLREVGYAQRQAGENLAGGPESLDEALAQWLASPTHCENLMAAEFQDFGLACVTGPGRWQHYWVLELATPAGPAPLRSSPDRSP